MTPQKFRHKPTVVEAMQFVPGNLAALDHWLATELGAGKYELTETHLVIETLEGDRDCEPGYWIVRGTHGEFYPVAPEVFQTVYEVAE